jgi:energy-coupling factor transporter ATP-binding protein EcfA2
MSENKHVPQHQPQVNTSNIIFRKAVKLDAKLRLAIIGPSGSGKTYTLLKIATGLGGRIAFADTERGSAEKYADLFDFDVLPLDRFDPRLVPELIKTAAAHGYKSLILDSLSHFYTGQDGELEQVDRVKMRLRDNGFAAWREITPLHNRMIDAMISAPIHVLVSMRVKTEWVVEKDDRTGKSTPRKVGLQPVMRDGIEYEFDVCGDMDQENTLVITKSRCPKLSGGVFQKPGAEVAEVLKAWLVSGVALPKPELNPKPEPVVAAVVVAEVPKEAIAPLVAVPQPAAKVSGELESIWKRMCSPRGVAQELERMQVEVAELAGTTGTAEFARILRQHGADRAKDFKTAQAARLCGREVLALLEELRANARENQAAAKNDETGEERS